MTPSEKAKQLVERFTHSGIVNWEAAKKDALICAEEMMSFFEDAELIIADRDINYWEQVKSEIEKI